MIRRRCVSSMPRLTRPPVRSVVALQGELVVEPCALSAARRRPPLDPCRRRAPSPTCSGPACASSSAASTPVASPTPRPRTSRTPATTSGGCSTTRGFTPRLYEPHEQFALLELGIGVTNAAHRTTPGSGDLRKGDFAGSAERLERLALELEPRAIGFVGKEAYRGAFGERPELGLQERRLGETRTLRAAVDLAGECCRPVRASGCAGSRPCTIS